MSPERLIDGPALWRIGSAERPKGPHVAVVPGADAPLLPVDLPAGLRGLARERVAGRQMSEALAVPQGALELFPFAPAGKKQPFSAVIVAGAEAAAGWRKARHPGCIAVLPDYLALPCIDGVWTLDTGDGDTVVARLGTGDGFTAEPDMALRLLAVAEAPRAILRLGVAQPTLDAFLAGREAPVFDSLEALAKSGAGKPLRWTAAAGGVDLGAAPSALYDRLSAGLARWRWPVLASGLALAAWLGAVVLETREYRAEAARAADLTRDLVRQHFVPEGPILNIRAQVEAAAQAGAVPDRGVRDLPALIQLQRAAPVLTRPGLALRTAEYRADTGLVTAVEAADFAGLDALVADLRAGGFLVEVLDSRSQVSGGIAARLRLQAEPNG